VIDMRGIGVGVLVLLAWLGAGASARAGVYFTPEGPSYLLPVEKLKLWVGELRGIAVPLEKQDPSGPVRASDLRKAAAQALRGSLRARYLGEAARLKEKQEAGGLSTVDRVDLGACYLRMGRPNEAIEVLEAGDRTHFLILANLASAYHAINEFDRAISYQKQALDAWPPVWAGWNGAEWQFYRRVERYYLELLRGRLREHLRNAGRPVRTLDALFVRGTEPVRFIGPSGRYEAGALKQDMADALPPDAYSIVLQLVLWLPGDDRLYYLLGELLNSVGQVEMAYEVLDELCSNARGAGKLEEIIQHRRVLAGAYRAMKELRDPVKRTILQCQLLSRGAHLPGAGVVGVAGYEGAAGAPVVFMD
jgi:hypothetical protein